MLRPSHGAVRRSCAAMPIPALFLVLADVACGPVIDPQVLGLAVIFSLVGGIVFTLPLLITDAAFVPARTTFGLRFLVVAYLGTGAVMYAVTLLVARQTSLESHPLLALLVLGVASLLVGTAFAIGLPSSPPSDSAGRAAFMAPLSLLWAACAAQAMRECNGVTDVTAFQVLAIPLYFAVSPLAEQVAGMVGRTQPSYSTQD